MSLNETQTQTTAAQFEGTLPDNAVVELRLHLNTDANKASLQLRLNNSAGLQGLVDDLKTIRNRLIQKYNLTP